MFHDGCRVVIRRGARSGVVKAVVGLVVSLRGWCSMVTGVGSDRHLRCRGKNKMSLRGSYQAGGACRHVKQTTVVLTQKCK